MSERAGHKLWHIILLSLAMFTGCFVAGMIPLATSLSQRKIQMFSLFGAGLLVGVALAVIIPEFKVCMILVQRMRRGMVIITLTTVQQSEYH